jgi:hypothetical protein
VSLHRLLCLTTTCLVLLANAAGAATLPTGFRETVVASGLRNPTAMTVAPDGRLFVCEQGGALRVIKNGSLLAAPFVTLTVNASGERGLLGVAIDPDFGNSPFVYVYYTATSPNIHNRVSRFRANGDVAAGSEEVLMNLEQLGATNHNGGAIHFGPDGKLYIAVGENAVRSNAQTLNNRLGKILRINSDGTIPEDNPFFDVAVGANRSIWALGLRNPFTFNFQHLESISPPMAATVRCRWLPATRCRSDCRLLPDLPGRSTRARCISACSHPPVCSGSIRIRDSPGRSRARTPDCCQPSHQLWRTFRM